MILINEFYSSHVFINFLFIYLEFKENLKRFKLR